MDLGFGPDKRFGVFLVGFACRSFGKKRPSLSVIRFSQTRPSGELARLTSCQSDEVARIGWVGVDPGLDLGSGIVDAGLARDIIGSAVREWTWPGNLPQLSEFLGLRRQGSSGKQKSSDHKQDPGWRSQPESRRSR